MRVHSLAILLGLTTATVASTQLSVQAATMSYQIQSGTTTLSLDNDLSPLGLSYKLDLDIIPPSQDPGIVGTNFTFSYDDQTQAFTPLSGAIEHTGSIAFNVDQTQLALLPTFEIGDFSLEFDDAGYYLRDNVSTRQRLFDLKINNAPTFDGTNLLIEGADVAVSQDFETILNNAAGYDVNLAGFTLAQAQISATATAVPEPEANVGISLLLAAGMAATIRRRHRAKKLEF
ncbi:hypothetical protein [Chlorogloea sp. CCALA 695]|uniref:hypothetical protein n=1 Tax=Chlorogloea sp. CCALA 695 TaxID=2107693 RepID=UPI0011B1CDD8|nr:hypothetical protein [Chlorogloea sp. CCALA 695]